MNPSQIITALTVLTFGLGVASAYHLTVFSIASVLWALLMLGTTCSLAFLVPRFNHMNPLQILKCLITTYIFGALDCYYFSGLANGAAVEPLGLYIILSTVRYYSEFQLVNCYHHYELEWSSFLIYHSKMYMLANLITACEHLLTRYVLDLDYKRSPPLLWVWLIFSLVTMGARIMAFFTAKSNFTHRVSHRKKQSHQLVTHGIYSLLRHPSYTGFFYFSIASMALIGNYASALAFALMLSLFFESRIEFEEYYLLKFFGDSYSRYRSRTYVLIPFVPAFLKARLPKI